MKGGIIAGAPVLTSRGEEAHVRDIPLDVCVFDRFKGSALQRMAPLYGLSDDVVRVHFDDGRRLILPQEQELILPDGRLLPALHFKNARACTFDGEQLLVVQVETLYVTATVFVYNRPCTIAYRGVLVPLR